MVDNIVERYISKAHSNSHPPDTGTKHVIYYKNQMSPSYLTDERILKNIINSNIACCNQDDRFNLLIFYISKKVSNMVMKNSPPPTPKRTNVVYEYKCNMGDCEHLPSSYIGMTTTTLSRRLTMHLQKGGPADHAKEKHSSTITREQLVDNTTILRQTNEFNRLQIHEALLIKSKTPTINSQLTGLARTLHLLGDQQAPRIVPNQINAN